MTGAASKQKLRESALRIREKNLDEYKEALKALKSDDDTIEIRGMSFTKSQIKSKMTLRESEINTLKKRLPGGTIA